MGTRPEIIKLHPVIKELKSEFEVVTVFTGQHKDLGTQMLKEFKIKPDYTLDVMSESNSLSMVAANLHEQLDTVLNKEKPDLVVVQGDTTTAFIGAIEAFYHKIPVSHVEAGLRSHDWYNPFPEEMHRKLIDQISTHNFAPTAQAADNLKRENLESVVTGNTGIDTLLQTARRIKPSKKWQVLVTLHRRESFGAPLERMLYGIKEFLAENPKFEVVLPVHPNPNVEKTVRNALGKHSRVKIVKPFGYKQMVKEMKDSYFIMTDSGGIQEEAPSLKRPVLVLRDTTERPEGVEVGVARVVGTGAEDITYEASRIAQSPLEYSLMIGDNPYGDGTASKKITSYLKEALS